MNQSNTKENKDLVQKSEEKVQKIEEKVEKVALDFTCLIFQ